MPIIRISNESFESVPMFPLKNVQLFPHTVLPLNIFEPRYLALVDYALEHDHLLTIADTSPSQDVIGGSANASPVRPILGAGVIVAKHNVAPQRYHILVQGVTRVILLDELEQAMPFRQVHAEILLDEEVEESPLFKLEDQVRDLVSCFAQQRHESAKALYEILNNAPNAEVLSNMLSANIVSAPELRQSLFEELNPYRRLEMIYQHIGDLLLEASFGTESDLSH